MAASITDELDSVAAGLAKLKPFMDEIKNCDLGVFLQYCMRSLPAYFWDLPASTSGTRHGVGESLIDRVVGCLQIADAVCDQMSTVWRQSDKDCLRAALLLHDGWRCGFPGQERRYPEDHERAGQLRSDPSHPEAGYAMILQLYQRYLATYDLPTYARDELSDLVVVIADAVRVHHGPCPWTRNSLVRFNIMASYSSVIVQVHNIDHMYAVTSRLRSRWATF